MSAFLRHVLIAAISATAAIAQAPATDGVTITFLANEGMMLAGGDKKIIIDGLFLPYRSYAVPPDTVQTMLRRARPPFDAVDLVLVTHRHGDHFHPSLVAEHLFTNTRATLLTSSQVIDSLRGRFRSPDQLSSRILARTTEVGTGRREIVNGIPVEILGLKHYDLEHLGYIVDVGGRRVLHVGDADDPVSAFAPFRLDTARIDVALLPSWMITNEAQRRAVEQWIRPKHVVGIHLPSGAAGERIARDVAAAWPGAFAFTRPLETRRW